MAFFPIRYGVLRPLLWALGAGPGVSGVTIEGDCLEALSESPRSPRG